MRLNLQCSKIIIWDCRSILQIVQCLKLWDLQALCAFALMQILEDPSGVWYLLRHLHRKGNSLR